MKEGLQFSRTFVQGVARVIVSTARALKADMHKMLDEACLARSVAIYRARSERMFDFVDRRLRIGPNGAAWMTPEDLYFFRHFNPIVLRAVAKDLGFLTPAQAEQAPSAARRVARAGSVIMASATIGRRRNAGTRAARATGSTDNRNG